MGERIRSAVAPYFKRKEFAREVISMICALAAGSVWPPLAPAAVCAAWLVPLSPYWALCGAAAGCLITGGLEGAIASALFAAFALLVSIWKPLKTLDKLVCLAVSQFVLLPLYHMKTPAACLTGLAGIAVSVLAAALFRRAAQGVRQCASSRMVGDVEQICIAVAAALFIASFRDIAVLGIRVNAVLSAMLCVLAVRIKGSGAVAAAVLAGAGCAVLGGAGMEFAGCLAAGTLVCALAGGGRWSAPALFLLSSVLLSLKVEGAATHIEAAVACCACIATPERWIQRARASVLPEERLRCERELDTLKRRVSDMAEVLTGLSKLQIGSFASRQLGCAGGALNRMTSEEPQRRRRFAIHCGAAACAKAGSTNTGDCMGIRDQDGCIALLLSDGMGSGDDAHRESSTVVALTGDLIAVGFELTEALECVNRLLIRKSAGDMYATLDAVLIDLFTGTARMVKFGAPPSYILRGDKLHPVAAEALPVGIVEEARPAVHEVNLKRGDTVVMLTDGVFDALGDKLQSVIIENAAGGTEDEAADRILRAAAQRERRDDMTVMVARIE